jgi:hypothetical protein
VRQGLEPIARLRLLAGRVSFTTKRFKSWLD